MIKVITVLVIGILGGACLWLGINSLGSTETIERQCITQQVYVLRPDVSMIIGEVVICGRDWEISNVVGPDVETWYGRVKLREWNPEEFTGDEE
jgi:hypothetical protein